MRKSFSILYIQIYRCWPEFKIMFLHIQTVDQLILDVFLIQSWKTSSVIKIFNPERQNHILLTWFGFVLINSNFDSIKCIYVKSIRSQEYVFWKSWTAFFLFAERCPVPACFLSSRSVRWQVKCCGCRQ